MKEISIDIETYSPVDLSACGVYRYAEDTGFELLLFGYSIDAEPVTVIDIANGEEIPLDVIKALTDNNITKWAFNAAFERVCLSSYLRKKYPEHFKSYAEDETNSYLDPISWRFSMVWSSYLSLPASLESVAESLELEQLKLSEGKRLIRKFSTPNGSKRVMLKDNPSDWEMFKKYNKRDVEVEIELRAKLSELPVPDRIWEEYKLDQIINDRGIAVDTEMAAHAVDIDRITKQALKEKIKGTTGITNPNSPSQFKKWLNENGYDIGSIDKREIGKLVSSLPPQMAEIIKAREQLAKSSVQKYQAMQKSVCKDGRCRGLFRFYGASRTGRWAGKIVQFQNLPQNHMESLDIARELVKAGYIAELDKLYDDVPQVLSELIRTAFIPQDGKKFIVADFSAIEARILSFIANETWRVKVFENGEDIYCKSAEKMFGCTVEKNGENSHLRKKGKIAELALGYGGGVGALKAMGALELGLALDELKPLVDSWRIANPHIVDLWRDVDRAARKTVEKGTVEYVNGCIFSRSSDMLTVTLPSHRSLYYLYPRIEINEKGHRVITYTSSSGNRIESYGAKLIENIVQGISRDVLAYALSNLSKYRTVAHVHDEVIIECDMDTPVEDICTLMSETPPWIEGLSLKAEGYETMYYTKM